MLCLQPQFSVMNHLTTDKYLMYKLQEAAWPKSSKECWKEALSSIPAHLCLLVSGLTPRSYVILNSQLVFPAASWDSSPCEPQWKLLVCQYLCHPYKNNLLLFCDLLQENIQYHFSITRAKTNSRWMAC